MHQINDQMAGYPRVIRLAHAGADNGTLLVAAGSAKDGLTLARSTDGGKTWSPSGAVHEGSYACCSALIELPRAAGDSPQGALILSGTVDGGGTIVTYRSLDHGRTWAEQSTVVNGGQGNGVGLWEPEFVIDSAGRLICFYSDERRQGEGFNQLLAHKVSTDGGKTWTDEKHDVAVPDGNARPGMARVVKVADGTYVMAYEVCGNPGCAVYTRTSPNGADWGDAANIGTRVQNGKGAYFVSAPGLAFVPGGAGGGKLVITAKYVKGGEDDQSGKLVMSTSDLTGTKGWKNSAAPVTVAVAGDGNHCANYSSSLLASDDGKVLLEVAGQDKDGQCPIVVGAALAP